MQIRGYMSQMGEMEIPFVSWDEAEQNPFFAPNNAMVPKLEAYLDAIRKEKDSIGAKITVVADHVPVGLGEPLYDRLDADIAYAMMGLNAAKGVEIGAGFASVAQRGKSAWRRADPRRLHRHNAGGILGGISSGQDIVVSVAIKPTSSIAIPRHSIDLNGAPIDVATTGRHDPASASAPRHRRSAAGHRVDGSCAAPARADADVTPPVAPIPGRRK